MRTLQQGAHLLRVGKLTHLLAHPTKMVTSKTELHYPFLKEIALPSINTSAGQVGTDPELCHL